MLPKGVLLSHVCQVEGLVSSHGSSGVIIANNWVLTHGSALHPNVRRTVFDYFKTITPDKLTKVPTELLHHLTFRALWKNSATFVTRKGLAAVTWTCSQLQMTFTNELHDWNFGKLVDELVSVFLLIRLNFKPEEIPQDNILGEAKVVLTQFSKVLTGPTVGCNAEIISTPFGFPTFLNTITRGIISNVLGLENCFFISDAFTSAGSEGAPVYVLDENKNKYICGLVLSLTRVNQSFSFGVNMKPSLKRILNGKKIADPKICNPLYALITRSVVVVRCGMNWGTGVIVNKKKGYILTCAHVISEAPQFDIKVLYQKDNCKVDVHARLVYSTPNALAYDVAILRVEPQEMDFKLRNIVINSSAHISQGESVAVIGYPFSSSSATISRGNVSNISAHMLQTTCCVQNGISGGPVVRWPTGEMLGLAVCNILCPIENEPQPRLNFAVPSAVFENILYTFYKTNDTTILEKLTCNDESVQRDWQLSFPPRSKSKL